MNENVWQEHFGDYSAKKYRFGFEWCVEIWLGEKFSPLFNKQVENGWCIQGKEKAVITLPILPGSNCFYRTGVGGQGCNGHNIAMLDIPHIQCSI